MPLVEQHVIDNADPRFALIDAAAFAAKNLYTAALYEMRQAYIFDGRYLGNAEIYHRMKHTNAYRALPCKVSHDVLRQLDKTWRAFFAALVAWKEDPSKVVGRPRLPQYKHKTKGRYLLTYDIQAISRRALARRRLAPSGLNIEKCRQPIAVSNKPAWSHASGFMSWNSSMSSSRLLLLAIPLSSPL